MRLLRVLLLTGLWGLLCVPSRGQALPPDSVGRLETFSKRIGLSTYTGYSRLYGQHEAGPDLLRYRFRADWLYNAAVASQPFVRNDYALDIAHYHRLLPTLYAGQRVRYTAYQANQTRITTYLPELAFRPRTDSLWQLETRAFAGLRRDARYQFSNIGPEYGAELRGVRVLPGGTGEAGGRVFIDRAQLGPRLFSFAKAEAYYRQEFNQYAQAELRAGYHTNRSADFLADNVQTIRSDTAYVSVRAQYLISKRLTFRSLNDIALPDRHFRYQPLREGVRALDNFGYQQQQLQTQQQLLYRSDKLDAQAEFGYRERTRRYNQAREQLKDIQERSVQWQYQLSYRLSRQHTLTAQTNAQLLRLDTPSELNNQDRDEVYYVARTAWQARWSPAFRTTLGLAYDDKEFIFIKGQQSIENYRDRILRYEPGFTWTSRRFSWTATLQVWTTYHVRAYATEQLKNRSIRTYFQTQQLRYDFTPAYAALLNVTRRENRTGLLNWKNFTESPLDTTTSYDLLAGLERRWTTNNRQTTLRLGYRYFRQGLHRKAGLLRAGQPVMGIYLHEITQQQGPELAFSHRLSGSLDLSTSVWLQFLDTRNRYRFSSLPFAGTSLTQEQLNRRQSGFYSFFEVTLNWRFKKR